jgi:type IV fimbrial biogenesis protein FimT
MRIKTGIFQMSEQGVSLPGSQKDSAQRGVTLLELLIAITIVALVAAIGVPSFSNFVDNQNRLSGTNELAYTLSLARSEALKRAEFVTVCRSTDLSACAGAGGDWTTGWIVFANTSSANAATREAGEPILYSYSAVPDDVDFVTDDLAAGLLTYQPSGDLGIDATWTWCDDRGAGDARAVNVDQAGRARVAALDVDGNALVCP